MGAFNYFNYYTEIEEYFWRKRGAHLLVSPLDWAIVETWQKAGIPLHAVLKGIDRAFESYSRSRRAAGGRQLKSLAYCVDAVLDAAEEEKEAAAGAGPKNASCAAAAETFSRDELRGFFRRNAERLARAAAKLRASQPDLAARIKEARRKLEEILPLMDSPAELDLEDLERRLTVLEQKLTAALTAGASEEVLLTLRREMDRQLAPYRRKMTAEQLAQLERQYTQKRLFETYELPRLSLFYLT
jgi:ribosome-binding protein aMBF1 (putative translation factor)